MENEQTEKLIEYYNNKIEVGFLELGLPDHMKGGVSRYILQGIKPGGFLTAILSNDLKEAAGRADSSNQRMLFEWASFIVNYIPAPSQGGPEQVNDWINRGGAIGDIKNEDKK